MDINKSSRDVSASRLPDKGRWATTARISYGYEKPPVRGQPIAGGFSCLCAFSSGYCYQAKSSSQQRCQPLLAAYPESSPKDQVTQRHPLSGSFAASFPTGYLVQSIIAYPGILLNQRVHRVFREGPSSVYSVKSGGLDLERFVNCSVILNRSHLRVFCSRYPEGATTRYAAVQRIKRAPLLVNGT